MSVDNALAFLKHLEARADLCARIAEFKGRQAIDALRRVAAAEGFHFSDADYRAAVVALAEGELSDEALAETQRELGMLDDDQEG